MHNITILSLKQFSYLIILTPILTENIKIFNKHYGSTIYLKWCESICLISTKILILIKLHRAKRTITKEFYRLFTFALTEYNKEVHLSLFPVLISSPYFLKRCNINMFSKINKNLFTKHLSVCVIC